MRIKKILFLTPLISLILISCNRGIHHETSSYILESPTKYNGGYNILQLTDTHIGNMCDRELQYKFLQKTINLSKQYVRNANKMDDRIDLIVVTGDLFTFATKENAIEFFSFLDSQYNDDDDLTPIPWTVCFGNHDEQCYFSIDWCTNYLNELNDKRIKSKSSNCVFIDHQDDDVFGNSNFVIQIKDKNDVNKVVENLYVLDSNRYNFQYLGYDNIHQDQIDWFTRCVKEIKGNNKKAAPGLSFFHIPVEQYLTYYNKAINKDEAYKFVLDEDDSKGPVILDAKGGGVDSAKYHSDDIYNAMIDKNIGSDMKGIFVGHNHTNAYSINHVDTINDINLTLSFGVKSTFTVNFDEDFLGGQLIMLNGNNVDEDIFENQNFSIHLVKHKYEDIDKPIEEDQ